MESYETNYSLKGNILRGRAVSYTLKVLICGLILLIAKDKFAQNLRTNISLSLIQSDFDVNYNINDYQNIIVDAK